MNRQAELAAAAEGIPASEESDEELAKKRMSQWVKGSEGDEAQAAEGSGDAEVEEADEEVADEEVAGTVEVGPGWWTPSRIF